jgi:hypothetical protein
MHQMQFGMIPLFIGEWRGGEPFRVKGEQPHFAGSLGHSGQLPSEPVRQSSLAI